MSPDRPPRFLCGAGILWVLTVVITFSDAGVPFPVWLWVSGFGAIFALCSMIRLSGAALLSRSQHGNWIRHNARMWIVILFTLIAGFALANTSHLFSLRLHLSANTLRESGPYLAAVPVAELHKEGRWVGLFRVREFSQFGSELRFITNDCGLVDSCGIVFSPDGPPPRRGEDSFDQISGPWWHWHQSW